MAAKEGVEVRLIPPSHFVNYEAGHVEQQNKTDQLCPHCGRWFTNRGVGGHVENCVFRENPYVTYDEDREVVKKRACETCGGVLRWDQPVGEQVDQHETACPFAPTPE